MARLFRFWPFTTLLAWSVQLAVPRQRIGVALVALDDAERVFLLRHVFHPYSPWGLPGGWLGRNEAPATAVLRELQEETGLRARLGPPVSVVYGETPPHVGIAYLGRIQAGDLRLSAEILEAGWFAMARLPAVSPDTQQAIKAAVTVHRQQQMNLQPAEEIR